MPIFVFRLNFEFSICRSIKQNRIQHGGRTHFKPIGSTYSTVSLLGDQIWLLKLRTSTEMLSTILLPYTISLSPPWTRYTFYNKKISNSFIKYFFFFQFLVIDCSDMEFKIDIAGWRSGLQQCTFTKNIHF